MINVSSHRIVDMCHNVKERVSQLCVANGVVRPPLISCRVTQVYDEGACVYFYLAFSYLEVGTDPVKLFEKIEVSFVSLIVITNIIL